ncbi:MAG: dTDP-4-dehydrorhamnose reductase [Christensenellales bacterium]|jgi:dTDP-4-dehydrorhamnose reductase
MILIIGANGQLGLQMQKALTKGEIAYRAYDYPDVDIASFESMDKLIDSINPDAVVNCAAYTNVDKAETDAQNAFDINAIGPKNLAMLCNKKNIELVHISTDYVFSGEAILQNGQPRPYIESDECDPCTVYGKTKLEGEKFISDFHDKWYILRTAWLYGDGNNFVRTMLKLSGHHDSVRVVNDQIGSPTSTADLAEAICGLINTQKYGLYHATCEGLCSWYDFTKKIFELKGISTKVIPVTSEEFIRPAKRPAWSVLENANLKRINNNVFRPWEDALTEYLFYN